MSYSRLAVRSYLTLRSIFVHGLFEGGKLGYALFTGRAVSFRPKGFKEKVFIRGQTWDAMVVATTFSKLEYKVIRPGEITTILDLGGNVGFTAVFFAHHYPNAKIVVVEPDKENFEALRKNISAYSNIIALQCGVWWRNANVDVINPDAGSWSYQFEEVGSGGVPCVTIPELISEYSDGGEVMVKMDIEGAEKDIFSRDPDWLGSVSLIQVEIHGCWKQIFDALYHYPYSARISGENVIIELEKSK